LFAAGGWTANWAIAKSIEPPPQIEPVEAIPQPTSFHTRTTSRSYSYNDDDEQEDDFWSENKSAFDDDGHGPLCICLSCTFLWGTSSSDDWMDNSSSDDTFTWASDD
jgi:hypothetical protein